MSVKALHKMQSDQVDATHYMLTAILTACPKADSTEFSPWEKQPHYPADTQQQSPYHAHGVPIIGFQPVIIPCGNTPQGGVPLQQHSCRLEEVQEVWAEEHVILHNDYMAVALLQEHPIQSPFVMLGQPSMPWLHSTAQQPLMCHAVAGRVYATVC